MEAARTRGAPWGPVRGPRGALLVWLAALAGCGQGGAVHAAGPEQTIPIVDVPERTEAHRDAPPPPEPAREFPTAREPEPRAAAVTPVVLGRALAEDTGGLDRILATRRVRVLVPYTPPFFFFDETGPHGITYEVFREFARFVEEREGLGRGEMGIVYVPCELDQIIPWLNEGYGDIAAGALTITPERRRKVAFVEPLRDGVDEVVVCAPDAPPVKTYEDLCGREIWVPAGSSYAEHAERLSKELVAKGCDPIQLRVAPATLSTEDLLEMASAGIVELTVCDDYKADLWKGVLADLMVCKQLVVHEAGEISWAVRKTNPELYAVLNEFVPRARKGSLLGNILIKRYFGDTEWIENPHTHPEMDRVQSYLAWMRELASEYDFDWRRIAAQCFQESGFDPRAKSSAGALGLMQLLPSTAKDMGCDDPYDAEQNLRAGVRYLDWLRENFFADPELDDEERIHFILAAYNAGPGNVRKWRRAAPERGLDPNRWRDHVEHLALESVGRQPVRYVDNIEMYYVAYSLARGLHVERESERSRAR